MPRVSAKVIIAYFRYLVKPLSAFLSQIFLPPPCRRAGRFGFDPEGFTAADFLSDAILFVTTDEEPPQALLAYISHGAGRPVTAQLVDARGDLRFFAFR